MNNEYPPKIEAMFNRAIELGFTERDFAELCVAAADQAGVSAKDQDKLRAIVGPHCGDCGDVLSDGECDICAACTATRKRIEAHDKLQAIEDGRGDYLRDQQKDRDRPDYDTREERDMDHE